MKYKLSAQGSLRNIERYVTRYNFLGLVLALGGLCLSLTPSLLPRPWLMQGVISGLAMAIGYGIGTFLSYAIRWLVQKELPAKWRAMSWKIMWILAPLVYVFFIYRGEIWQNDVRRLVDEQPMPGSHIVRIALITFVVFLLVISIARLIRIFVRWIQQKADIFLPRRLAGALGIVVGVLVVYGIVSGVIAKTLIAAARNHYDTKNATTPVGVTQPRSPFRSGSPESLVPWSTVGYQGQSFVSRGPSQAQLQAFSGLQPKQQIRLYAGLESAANADDRASLVVREMQRTGAFTRKVVILATATGTGWLEPQSVDSLEYMYNGDSAIVSQQYSDLPSWISFLVDKQTATEAGQALYNAVYAQWSTLPKETRPKLIAYGLSLGSFGGQAAYNSAQDLALSIDGALFMGTPSDTLLWSTITDKRDAGSPMWQPTYQGGKTVRFAATNSDINQSSTTWKFPRILYMQHASDPVVWFNFGLPLHMPAWLDEPRGPDVSKSMFWFPILTFLQVTVDQFYGVTVPNGHGHNYPNTIATAWSAVVPPIGWTPSQTEKLQTIIDAYSNE